MAWHPPPGSAVAGRILREVSDDFEPGAWWDRLRHGGGVRGPRCDAGAAAGSARRARRRRAYHTSYAALTDYEAGLWPLLNLRQHLVLDAAGATALCAAGLLLRRAPAGARGLLLGAGLAELAVVALADPVAARGARGRVIDARRRAAPEAIGWAGDAAQVGYPPLDVPKPVADGVWVVDSTLPGLLGTVLPVRMTVLRLPDGTLLLHSPTRFSAALHDALAALGPVRHFVAPSPGHWLFLKDWQQAVPAAQSWAAPGLRLRRAVRRQGVRIDQELRGPPPAVWGGAVATVPLPGALGFCEVALFHRPSRTLLLADLALNLQPEKLPALARPLLRALGVVAPDGMAPPYLRALVRRRPAARRAAEELLGLAPERVVFAHGRWFERDGAAALRRSWRWLLD